MASFAAKDDPVSSGSSEAVDHVKALELAYNFALTYSSTFNMGGVAVVFGLFSMLILLDSAELMSPTWIVLSLAYFLTILTVLYFFLRAIRYSLMGLEAARRLGILNLAEEVYNSGLEAESFLHRVMAGRFNPYGPFTKLYFVAGPIVLIVLWAVIAFF